MATPTSTKCKTGKVRFSFADSLYNPKPNDRGDLKYSVALLIPKSDTTTYQAMCDASEACKRIKLPGKDETFYKAPPKVIHDGDALKDSGDAYDPECKGHWVVSVSSNEKPGFLSLDASFNPAADKVRSGDFGKVSLNAYYFEVSGKKGVTFGLNNVLFMERGERIDGRTSAADDFAEEVGEAF